MNPKITALKKGKVICLQGLGLQGLVFLVVLGVASYTNSPVISAMTVFIIAGLFVWSGLLAFYYNIIQEAIVTQALEGDSAVDQDDSSKTEFCEDSEKKLEAVKQRLAATCKFLLPLVEIIIIIMLFWQAFSFYEKYRLDVLFYPPSYNANVLLMAVFMAVIAGAAFIGAYYFNLIATNFYWRLIKSGAGYLFGTACLALLGAISFFSYHFEWESVYKYAIILSGCFCFMIALELTLKMFLSFFRPRRKGAFEYPLFEPRFLYILSHPKDLKKTIDDVVNHQLGFELSQSSFYRLCLMLLIPFVSISVMLLLLMSSIVIIRPYEQGLLVHWGTCSGQILQPGIHFKAPWPIQSVRVADVSKVRRLYVGSLFEEGQSGDIYKKDTPVLWTNLHGYNAEELLIVAPPSDLLKRWSGMEHDSMKVPSISLVAADVVIDYRINNLWQYSRVAVKPDLLFKQLAEMEVSRELYKYDIDSLLTTGRAKAGERLQTQIQKVADEAELGIEVLYAGFSGVHPPQQVAEAFQETVSALQEKETDIQWAKAYSIRKLTEAVGSTDNAGKMIADITLLEKTQHAEKDEQNVTKVKYIFMNAGGQVAEMMGQAYAHRWRVINKERGKTDRFLKQHLLYRAAPEVFKISHIMSAFEAGMKDQEKYLFTGKRENLILRFDFKDYSNYVRRYFDKDDPELVPDDR